MTVDPDDRDSLATTIDVGCRWEQYAAEMRANMVRCLAIGIFYVVYALHRVAGSVDSGLLHALGFDAGLHAPMDVHIAITCIMLAWVMLAFWIHHLLVRQVFPDWLKYVSTVGDIALLSLTLVLTSGASSPMVAGYFLVLMMTALRLDLRLVRWTTVASLVGYLVVLGCSKWPIGLSKTYELPTVPRYHQMIMLSAILLAGILAGQWVRQARQLLIRVARAVTGEQDS